MLNDFFSSRRCTDHWNHIDVTVFAGITNLKNKINFKQFNTKHFVYDLFCNQILFIFEQKNKVKWSL